MLSMIDSDIIHDQPMMSILMACAESVGSLSFLGHFHPYIRMSHSIVSPEVSFGVPVCNSFALLSDECATPAVL